MVVEQERVPNVMSRSIPKEPVNPPRSLEEAKELRDSLRAMALTMDTIIYNTRNTVRYQNKVIDTLWKWKVDSKEIIDSLVGSNRKMKDELDKFKYTYFDTAYFNVWHGVADSVSFKNLPDTKPLPQPLGRTQSPVASPSWFYYHSIQYPIND